MESKDLSHLDPIFLVNIGSPHSSQENDVALFLKEFLMDRHIVTVPYALRYFLVNKIIVPRRKALAQKRYLSLVSMDPQKGMPLVYYSHSLAEKLRRRIGRLVCSLFRYGDDRWDRLSSFLQEAGCPAPRSITLVPLFPQYTYSTAVSIFDFALPKIRKALGDIPVYTPRLYYLASEYTQSWSRRLSSFDNSYHFVASFHSIPHRHRALDGKKGISPSYREQCFETAKEVFRRAGIAEDKYEIVFQSRMGHGSWEGPCIEDRVAHWQAEGHSKVVVFSPGFMCDCLETVYDLDLVLKKQFLEAGGQEWHYLTAFNDSDPSIDLLETLLTVDALEKR